MIYLVEERMFFTMENDLGLAAPYKVVGYVVSPDAVPSEEVTEREAGWTFWHLADKRRFRVTPLNPWGV